MSSSENLRLPTLDASRYGDPAMPAAAALPSPARAGGVLRLSDDRWGMIREHQQRVRGRTAAAATPNNKPCYPKLRRLFVSVGFAFRLFLDLLRWDFGLCVPKHSRGFQTIPDTRNTSSLSEHEPGHGAHRGSQHGLWPARVEMGFGRRQAAWCAPEAGTAGLDLW